VKEQIVGRRKAGDSAERAGAAGGAPEPTAGPAPWHLSPVDGRLTGNV
jgi:hypothetical protein